MAARSRKWVSCGLPHRPAFGTYGVWDLSSQAPLPPVDEEEEKEEVALLGDFAAACQEVSYGSSPTACHKCAEEVGDLPDGWRAQLVYVDQQGCAMWWAVFKTGEDGTLVTKAMEGHVSKPDTMTVVGESFFDFVRRTRYENALWYVTVDDRDCDGGMSPQAVAYQKSIHDMPAPTYKAEVGVCINLSLMDYFNLERATRDSASNLAGVDLPGGGKVPTEGVWVLKNMEGVVCVSAAVDES